MQSVDSSSKIYADFWIEFARGSLLISDRIDLNDDEIVLILIATKYHILEAYPTRDRQLPPKEEIKPILAFADHLLERVCTLLNISTDEIKSEPN